MPMEAIWADLMPQPRTYCPACGKQPFDTFMRGQVARFDWWGLRRRIWAVICRACKEIIDYEEIPRPDFTSFN